MSSLRHLEDASALFGRRLGVRVASALASILNEDLVAFLEPST